MGQPFGMFSDPEINEMGKPQENGTICQNSSHKIEGGASDDLYRLVMSAQADWGNRFSDAAAVFEG